MIRKIAHNFRSLAQLEHYIQSKGKNVNFNDMLIQFHRLGLVTPRREVRATERRLRERVINHVLPKARPSTIARVAWVYGRLRLNVEDVMIGCQQELYRTPLKNFRTDQMVSLCWANAALGYQTRSLFEEQAKILNDRLSNGERLSRNLCYLLNPTLLMRML